MYHNVIGGAVRLTGNYNYIKRKYMNVYINNVAHDLPEDATVPTVLQAINIISDKGIALAINNVVASRNEWSTCIIKDGDKITLIKATQGG